jgi:F-type H+-transporting ATPase subunit beta
VVEAQTGLKGKYVPISQTIKDVENIINGKYDSKSPDDFISKGALDDIR